MRATSDKSLRLVLSTFKNLREELCHLQDDLGVSPAPPCPELIQLFPGLHSRLWLCWCQWLLCQCFGGWMDRGGFGSSRDSPPGWTGVALCWVVSTGILDTALPVCPRNNSNRSHSLCCVPKPQTFNKAELSLSSKTPLY